MFNRNASSTGKADKSLTEEEIDALAQIMLARDPSGTVVITTQTAQHTQQALGLRAEFIVIMNGPIS